MMSLNMGRDYYPMFSVMCARGDSGGDQPLVGMIHLSPSSSARGAWVGENRNNNRKEVI